MPRALPPEIRLDIVRRHLNGQALPQSATELRLSSDTVRALWRTYRDSGEQGLALHSTPVGDPPPAPRSRSSTWRANSSTTTRPGGPAGSVWNGSATSCRTRSPAPHVLQRAFRGWAGVNRPRRFGRSTRSRRPGSPPGRR